MPIPLTDVVEFNAGAKDTLKFESIQTHINRWINDSTHYGKRFGHFEQAVDNPLIKYGIRMVLDHAEVSIVNIVNDGDNFGQVEVDNDEPLSKIHKMYGLNIDPFLDMLTVNIPYYPEEAIFGDGRRGNVVISTTTTVNNYTYLLQDSFNNKLFVDNVSNFSVGELIFIHQTAIPDYDLVGRYEYCRISKINPSENSIELEDDLSTIYYSGQYDDYPATVSQIVSVPEYNDLTVESGGKIVPQFWDGYCGGIIVFRCLGTLKIESCGLIDANYSGYRGGLMDLPNCLVGWKQASPSPNGGWCGEGFSGKNYIHGNIGPRNTRIYAVHGGAGPGRGGLWDCTLQVPGSGGSNATMGQNGGNLVSNSGTCPTKGGGATSSIEDDTLSRMVFGGGGAGGRKSEPNRLPHGMRLIIPCGSNGGNGGGIICANVYILDNSGTIRSNGRSTANIGGPYAVRVACPGSAGAGGTIYITSVFLKKSGYFSADGGQGGDWYKYMEYYDVGAKAGKGYLRHATILNDNQSLSANGAKSIVSDFSDTSLNRFRYCDNEYYLVETTSTSQIDLNLYNTINSINVDYLEPINDSGCDVKILISYDNKRSWISWDGNSWNIVNKNNITEYGMSIDTINSLTYTELMADNGFRRGVQTLDFAIVMKSNLYNSYKIRSIAVSGVSRTVDIWDVKRPRKILESESHIIKKVSGVTL